MKLLKKQDCSASIISAFTCTKFHLLEYIKQKLVHVKVLFLLGIWCIQMRMCVKLTSNGSDRKGHNFAVEPKKLVNDMNGIFRYDIMYPFSEFCLSNNHILSIL